MKKIFALLSSIVFLLVATVVVSAQSSNATIPEQNGDYPVPGRSDVRVRVFVHEPKERPVSSSLAICEDPHVNAVVGSAGWKLPNGTWKYKVNTSSFPVGVPTTIVSNSFSTWTDAISSSSKPNLVSDGTTLKTRNALDYENIITWGRTNGSALGVTYVWYYTATHEVADVDTIMNKKFPWSATCNSTYYNAQNIIIHELGHWFGLNDHYTAAYVDNTMFGYGSKAETKKITPEQGDKDGINLIYP